MRCHIASWCQVCTACQSSKIQTHIHTPVQTIPKPDTPFSHIHMDIVGPLPPSRGYSYLLTIMDHTTQWLYAIRISGITAEDCARALCLHWISQFGIPLHLTSDHRRQFMSTLWTHLATFLGTQLHHTMSYHPQSNGLMERLHRTLKAALRACLALLDWYDHLPWILLSLQCTPKEDLGACPADINFRHSPLLPDTLLSPLSSPDGPRLPPIIPASSQLHHP